jgi:hypothetical protein
VSAGSTGERRTAGRRWGRWAALAVVVGVWLVPLSAPATIEEQRARLPPPADCEDDPVAGLWKSHQYDEQYRDWTVFMLDIRRVPGSDTQLVGTITNHSWDAGPEQQEPGPCAAFGNQWIVSMDARGTIGPDGRIHFGGIGAWRLDRIVCNGGPGGYNLDNFSGVIDPTLQEFQSVNNDGGRAVNDPTVFRRIRCHDQDASPPSPHVNPVPPAFYPSLKPSGCS